MKPRGSVHALKAATPWQTPSTRYAGAGRNSRTRGGACWVQGSSLKRGNLPSAEWGLRGYRLEREKRIRTRIPGAPSGDSDDRGSPAPRGRPGNGITQIGDRDPTAVPRHFAIRVSSNCRQLVDDRGAINSTRDLYGKTQAEFALGIDVE